MVGYEPGRDEYPRQLFAISGALSGMVTRACLQPLDVIKIRFQLQEEPLKRSATSKYHGMIHAFKKISQEEGVIALWKAHNPAQLLSILYGVVQFYTFEILTKEVWVKVPTVLTTDFKPIAHFVCGSLSGCTATLVCQPLDVIRTRIVAQGEPKDQNTNMMKSAFILKIYRSSHHAFRTILSQEGVYGLYRGLIPTLIQSTPLSGFQFAFYALFTGIWKKIWPRNGSGNGAVQTFVCGGLAGLGAKAAVYPLDLSKKRLQVQGFQKARLSFGRSSSYRGLIHCLIKIPKEEGLLALYKGLSPSLYKAVMSGALHFCVYEQTCKVLKELYDRGQ